MRSNAALAALPCIAWCVLAPGLASAQERREPQYRTLALTDGRTLTAEILSTEPTGLLVRTPQGDSLVSFEILLDMAPTDAAAYQNQQDWVVYYDVSGPLNDTIVSMLAAIPGISAHPVGAVVNEVDPFAAQKAKACNGDGQCVADATTEARWMWILTASGTVEAPQLRGHLNLGATRTRVDVADTSDEPLWLAIHEALGMRAPSAAPPSSKPAQSPRAGRALSTSSVTALSFIPLPGVPSAAQGDWGGFGLAWLIALPAGGAFAGASLAAPEREASSWAMLGAGSYLSVVFANQVTGMRSQKKVTVAPVARAGAGGVVVAGAF